MSQTLKPLYFVADKTCGIPKYLFLDPDCMIWNEMQTELYICLAKVTCFLAVLTWFLAAVSQIATRALKIM